MFFLQARVSRFRALLDRFRRRPERSIPDHPTAPYRPAAKGAIDLRELAPDFNSSCEILCPLCGENYVHLAHGLRVIDGGVDLFIPDDVIEPIGPLRRVWSQARGRIISIPMCCENEHEWCLNLQFHKGCTYAWVSDARSFPPGGWPGGTWRD